MCVFVQERESYLPAVPDELTLPEPGLRPYSPQKCAGILMLPPISDPHPIADPPIAKSAPSPPLDPPGVYFPLYGFVVTPQRGFEHSQFSRPWGTLVLTMGIPPRFTNVADKLERESKHCKFRVSGRGTSASI